nr:ATP-dependent RNA helicase SUPV3L1, mitochondrial isoform X2 [Caretta caretta]
MYRCVWLLSRLPPHLGLSPRYAGAASAAFRGLGGLRHPSRAAAASSSSSSEGNGGRALDTSLFVPLHVQPLGPSPEGDIGAELTQPLNKSEVLKILNKFYKRKEMQRLGGENGLDARLFHQAFISFRKYVMESSFLSADVHIILNDICCGAGHVDDLFPFFLRHAKQIFPMLDCMDDLRKISDLRLPPNWYPEARAIQRKIVFHAGPTNSGKTHHAIQRYLAAKSGIYCGPLKLLAHEIFQKSNDASVPCDLVTGEERVLVDPEGRQATHVACTIEMCSVTTPYEVAVIDEIQMIKDPARGWAWTRALLGLSAEEVHICGEAAAIDLVTELMYSTGEEVEVRNYKRLTPITVLDYALESLDNLRPGDCIVCFNKNDIYSVSRQIEARGLECAVIYGSLPPGTKLTQAKKFNDPDDPCKILVATDAIGMGLNLSIKRIIFNSLIKPSINEKGEKEMDAITTSQALQISGRAGRFSSVFKEGEVTAMYRDDLVLLKEILNRSVPPIETAGLHPTAEQIEMFAYHLPDATLSNLMFARQFSRNEPLTFDWICRHSNWPLVPPKNIKDLVHLEAVHDVFDLYLWLSYRFMDMFPDASLVRDIQKELDNIIQIGVRNITRLIRASEATSVSGAIAVPDDFPLQRTEVNDRMLNLEDLPAANQDQFSNATKVPGQKRIRRSKALGYKPAEVQSNMKSHGQGSLAARLVREGLLTQEMLKQLEREWQVHHNNNGNFPTEKRDNQNGSKGTGKKKK